VCQLTRPGSTQPSAAGLAQALAAAGNVIVFGDSCVQCPYCSHKISLFSKAANMFGNKFCPKCNGGIKLKLNWKIAFPLIVLFAFIKIAITQPIANLGLNYSLVKHSLSIASFFIMLGFSLRVVKNETFQKP
jgi:hypothetical protein